MDIEETLTLIGGDMLKAIEAAKVEDMDELDDIITQAQELIDDAQAKFDELEAYPIKTEQEAREAYDSMLDEVYHVEDSPNWMGKPSEHMKENDPIMYRCGFNDWIDGQVTDKQAPPEGVDWSVG